MAKDEKRHDEPTPCPHCGYCPTCGRAAQPERVVYVPMPYYQPTYTPVTPTYPGWWGIVPPVVSGGNITVDMDGGTTYTVN